MAKIHQGERFVNLATHVVIEVVQPHDEQPLVATVTETGKLSHKRPVKAGSLKLGHLTRRGTPAKSGYVRVSSLPDNHPLRPAIPSTAEVTEKRTAVIPDHDPDFTEFNTEALSAFIAKMEAQAKLLGDMAKNAKDELKNRTSEPGLRIYGDIAVVATRPEAFDEEKALRAREKGLITPEMFKLFEVTKVDGAKAKGLLGEKSPAYRACLKPALKLTMSVRPATDEDRKKAGMDAQREAMSAFVPGAAIDTDDTPF